MVPDLAAVSRWGVLALPAGFCVLILINILSGRIRLNGLLSGDRADGQTYFSLGRAQLLAVTFFTAGQLLYQVYLDGSKLPEISSAAVALFGGSAAVYSGEKAWAMLFRRSTGSARREV